MPHTPHPTSDWLRPPGTGSAPSSTWMTYGWHHMPRVSGTLTTPLVSVRAIIVEDTTELMECVRKMDPRDEWIPQAAGNCGGGDRPLPGLYNHPKGAIIKSYKWLKRLQSWEIVGSDPLNTRGIDHSGQDGCSDSEAVIATPGRDEKHRSLARRMWGEKILVMLQAPHSC